jgi:hypothetical protein
LSCLYKIHRSNFSNFQNKIHFKKKGKYGAYIYYKDPEKENPEFYNLKAFIQKKNPLKCELIELTNWMEEIYGII